MICYIFVWKN